MHGRDSYRIPHWVLPWFTYTFPLHGESYAWNKNITLMPCVNSLKIATGSPRKSLPHFLYERDPVMRLPFQKDCLVSEPQCPFLKLTFKLSGNSASFCFAFRSCFVSSGSVMGSFTSSLLSRQEQVLWVTVLLKWLHSLALLYREHWRELDKCYTLGLALAKVPNNCSQRDRPLRSCLSFSLSSPFQAALFTHRTNTPCVSGSYWTVVSLCAW